MAQKHLVCQGATCQCQFGNAPDKLKVLTQTKAFINEEEPQEKLVATTADIGATFEKNTCPIGGKDCISIINHGQVSEITNRNLHSADPIKMDMINPFMDFSKFVNDILTKPDITEAYFTDLQGNKIELGEDEQDIYLVIEGKNLLGLTMDFNLNNKDLDFKYKDNILENDTLKDYTFTNDTQEQIPLTVINTKK